jgi:hypothetical protein
MLLSKTLEKSHQINDTSAENNTNLGALFTHRTTLVMSLSKGFVAKSMKLLVTMSSLLTITDYRRLGPYLWEEVVSDGDGSLTASVCPPPKLSECNLTIHPVGGIPYNAVRGENPFGSPGCNGSRPPKVWTR